MLTNRRVYSAAESFVLMMRVIPEVTVVGGTTGGGSGNPEVRPLSNSWKFTVSRWWIETPEGEPYEGVGLVPDVPVDITAAEEEEGRATILETALDILEGALGG